jgi:hypothetical protein
MASNTSFVLPTEFVSPKAATTMAGQSTSGPLNSTFVLGCSAELRKGTFKNHLECRFTANTSAAIVTAQQVGGLIHLYSSFLCSEGYRSAYKALLKTLETDPNQCQKDLAQ